jgi:glycosyltransferase involved in cell wall biosynthesis
VQKLLFVSNLFPDQQEPLRGLDNAVLLRTLGRDLDIRVLSPRPTRRSQSARGPRALPEDDDFAPAYQSVPYVPRFGSRWNAHLMRRWMKPAFEQIVDKFSPEAVLVSWLFPDACATVPLSEQHGLPTVLITQGTDTHSYIESASRRRQILAAIDAADGVVCRSADLGKRLANAGADPAKLHTVYNGIDSSIFRPRDQSEARQQIQPKIEAQARVLLFVGNFLPVKNPTFLLHAHAELRKRTENRLFLYLIGSGPLESELRSDAARLGTDEDIVFTGPLPSREVARHMNAADLLCLSSHNEGFPNVILEAMASGLPIVSTDVGGISELIDAPDVGQLVKPGSLPDYVTTLENALTSAQNRSTKVPANRDFSWSFAADQYRKILESAALPVPK